MTGSQLVDDVTIARETDGRAVELDVNDEIRIPGPAVDVDADDVLSPEGGVTAMEVWVTRVNKIVSRSLPDKFRLPLVI